MGNSVLDRHTQGGAMDLARRVNTYWRERGYDARAEAYPLNMGFNTVIRTANAWGVRSITMNGVPTTRLPFGAQATLRRV